MFAKKKISTNGDFDKKYRSFIDLEVNALKLSADLKAYLKSVRTNGDKHGEVCNSLQQFFPSSSSMGKSCATLIELHNDCNSGQLNEIISTVEGPVAKKLDAWIADFAPVKKAG
jgi:hypothetical protein